MPGGRRTAGAAALLLALPVTARTYVDRITEPVLIRHGAVDATCPPRWSRTTQRLLDV